MDSQLFKMPNVPLITVPPDSFNGNNGKRFSKYQYTNNNQSSNIGLSQKQLEKSSKLNRANINMINNNNNKDNFSNCTSLTETLNTKLCSTCSKILVKTLLPIENCLENLYKLVDPLVLSECKQTGNSISADYDQSVSINDNNTNESKNELNIELLKDACKSINDNDKSIAKNNDHLRKRTNILNKTNEEENIYNSAILDAHGAFNNNGDNKIQLNFSSSSTATKSSSNNHFQNGDANIDHQQKNNNEVINYSNQQTFIIKENVANNIEQSNVYNQNICPSKTNQFNETKKLLNGNTNSNDGKFAAENITLNEIDKQFESARLDNSLKQNEFAFVTIISSNLSAINAILLAQSIYLNNNQYLNTRKFNSWQIDQNYYIPIVALIGNIIDTELRLLITKFFDQVRFIL